ncbi:MAG TPA: TonB-dependent receptor [Rudaea sp.]|jgi:outer membrane receptor protein involved in Fe transport|nr:TonB-dependent receptor [Rudaea sp.]
MNTSRVALAIQLGLMVMRTSLADTQPAADPADTQTQQQSTQLGTVEVSAALDRSRDTLSPEIGASQYVFERQTIDQFPLGDSTPLNQILLQAPGVVQDSYGQLHVRGDHADLQYRINGIIIPESISGFGQTLDARVVEKMQLLTGALPAQYGYRTAGIVEITSKPAPDTSGGSIGVTMGSFGTFNPEFSLYGNEGRWSYFLTGNFLENDIGIENPTSSRNAIHDHTDQTKGFGYVSYLLTDDSRVSFIFGTTNNRFQIPNNPDQQPSYTLNGVDSFDSSKLDERQREVTDFGVFALQGKFGDTNYQVSLGERYTGVKYAPDSVGDLIFNGVAGTIDRSNRADTLQADFSTPILGGSHTIRYGLYASDERPVSDNSSLVFPADADGNQTSDTPIVIVDNAPHINAKTYGVYVQDEWNLTDQLTMNYGIRADKVDAYVHEGQISPRLGFVYQATDTTTLHAGYARYFTPPPTELISPTDIALFQGTTNQLPGNVNAETLSERSHYFDVGVSQKIGDGFTVGLDGYYRKVHNLLDEGQFGAALIFSPFNYAQGRVRGLELSSDYTQGNFTAYANLSTSRAMGKDVVTGQYNFDPDELAYIATHWVHLDHDQRLAGSGGVSYNWNGTRFGGDVLYGSGLRAGFANTEHLPQYYQVNLSADRTFDLPEIGNTNVRLALINVTDKVYEIRDGSGIGVGAPQFGPRRGVYVGLTKNF